MVAWPDFRARIRRFLVIGLGMALVLAITLLLSAFSEGFNLRGERLLNVFGAERYIVAEGSSGPMTSTSPLNAALRDSIYAQTGETTTAIFMTPNALLVDDQPVSVVVVGTPPTVDWPRIVEGRGIEGPTDAVVDLEVIELELGDMFTLAGNAFEVVGRTEHATWDISTAGVFVDADVMRTTFAGGLPLATTIAIEGDEEPATGPGYELRSRASAVADVVARTDAAKRSIDSFTITLWILAIVIVGAVLYLAALERVPDFAIFKATGASNLDLVLGLALQAAMVGAIAGVLSIGLAHLMKPIYPGLLSLPFRIAWLVIPVAVVIAVVSSFFGVRRAIKVDPSQAFG